MQFKHRKISSKCCKIKRKKHGFALIASLTLMMLLTMLAVGILAMASSQNRIAAQTVLQSEARQQALMGLDAAIGELQLELGPDQRITASSSILSASEGSNTQHLLGVWNSWDGPIYGKSATGKGSKISETYDTGRSKMFRRWLISSIDPKMTRNIKGAGELGTRMPGRRICLVGEGTLGTKLQKTHHIYADLISMPAAGNNTGCFAWWIGGENQKSKISFQNPEKTDNPVEVLHRTWDTPAPIFVDNHNVDFLPENIETPEKLLTMASLPLLDTAGQDAGMPYFFDITTFSYTLPVNVRDGGLKKDLCLLLNRKSMNDTEYAPTANRDCPIVDPRVEEDVPQGSEPEMPIGSWQTMHAYYNSWPDGSGSDEDFGTRLVGSLDGAYTRMAGELVNGQASDCTYYEPRADMNRNLGYPRTPVMLAFMNNFGLVADKWEGKLTSDTKDPLYQLRMCFSPMVLWWNPYNVPMKIRGDRLWAQSVPYKSMWLQTLTKGYGWNYSWGTYAMTQSSGAAGFGRDWGNYFQSKAKDADTDIIFAPGEIVFFSPGVARISSEYNRPLSNPWAEGYSPTSVAGYKAHFYGVQGKHDQSDVTSGFNIDQGLFRVGIRLGINAQGGSYRTDGFWFAPGHNEAITVYSGYAGMGAPNDSSGSIGKHGESPQRYLLGWYNPDDTEIDTTICRATWETEGQDDPSAPYFIASVGIVAKSGNGTLDNKLFPSSDFRTKLWQHSSPALWGGMIMSPSDQQRQYHPYQLAAFNVGGAAAASPMDNIGRNGMLGITSEGEQVSFASVCELPLHPPFSLAGFAGMRLTPGWYKPAPGSSLVAMRRAQYQSGVPGVGIGNSFADPCLPAGDIYRFYGGNKIPTDVAGNARLFSEFYDHGLLINDALWDTWFCSSVSDMPTAKGRKQAKEVLTNFLSGKEALPVSRYKRTQTPYKDEDIVKRVLNSKEGWNIIAQYLIIDGGFNINSTSEEAWASVLQGLAGRKLVTNVSGKLALVDESKSNRRDQVLFSRFMVSTTGKSLDSLGGYSAMQGSSSLRKASSDLAAWGEVRSLDSDTVRLLAKEIVKQVRERGPFLSMSDFVNRRLDPKGGKAALKGALQAAIDATRINENFDEQMVRPLKNGDLFKFPEAEEGSLYTAAPGYLIQSDVLASLGNILTLRDDTFTIRAYGCVRNARNAILAQAWCEAIVQRTIDYVDPTNAPEDVDTKGTGKNSKKNKPLSKINKAMGRKFRIVSFKWLDAWDI